MLRHWPALASPLSRCTLPATMRLPDLTPSQLLEFLLAVAPRRPVMIRGQPGIGKSALVEKFAADLGMPCVSLLGSQLAPEDLLGVPQIIDGVSRFCPPAQIARKDPYVLFLDELNGCSHEIQKAFYSLIHERRLGDYHLPGGSVVIAAGNRAEDNAIVKPLSSALVNRMVHVQLRVSVPEWLQWAAENSIHHWVADYIRQRPDHLCAPAPKIEEPFSTPRSWHMLSDQLQELCHEDEVSERMLEAATAGCLSPIHAGQFRAYIKQVRHRHTLDAVLTGDQGWPRNAKDADLLYFLAMSLRSRLSKELPARKDDAGNEAKQLAHRAKALLVELADINTEVAQMVVAAGEDDIPDWFLLDAITTIPRLAARKK
jgi:MoxR-like ATPase